MHEGGVADPLIVSWPAGIAGAEQGHIRAQYVHAIDILPTLLEVLGIDPPGSVDGVTFAPTLARADAPDAHTVQYYEMFGSRALYQDGWKAVIYHAMQSDDPGLDVVPWELYNVVDDPSETRDLAAEEPGRLQAMVERWWEEAGAMISRSTTVHSRLRLPPPVRRAQRRALCWPGSGMVSEESAVNTRNREHVVTAHVDGDGEGVLLSQGSLLGGWTFFKRGSTLSYVHNFARWREYRVDAEVTLAPGPHSLQFRYASTSARGGDGELLVDGAVVGHAAFKRVTPIRFSLTGAGLWCGRGGNLEVCDDYTGPSPGRVRLPVVVEVEGHDVGAAAAGRRSTARVPSSHGPEPDCRGTPCAREAWLALTPWDTAGGFLTIRRSRRQVAFGRAAGEAAGGRWVGVRVAGGVRRPGRARSGTLVTRTRAGAPESSARIGVNLVGPTLSRRHRRAKRWLPNILGERIWCQLFSEPGAGSDLTSLQTRAEPVEGGYVLNGQKVWTSYAQFADWGWCLARTNTDAPKSKGISALVVDMHTPGVEVRPLRQITDETEFNEVFFTDVFVDDRLVGPRRRVAHRELDITHGGA